ncbi:membrane protein YcjF [Klebsiella oxytoca]|nr:membrane protein YcjF [Klebsiella oxytoca]
MTEPLKPRIDFDGPLEVEKAQILKSARAFDGADAEKFALRALTRRKKKRGRRKW